MCIAFISNYDTLVFSPEEVMKKKKSARVKSKQEDIIEDEDDFEDEDDLDYSLKRAWKRRLENMIVDKLPVALRDIEDIKDKVSGLEASLAAVSKTAQDENVKLSSHLKMHKFVWWLLTIITPIIVSLLMLIFGKKFDIGL